MWGARCGESRTAGSAGGPGFPQSSGELRGCRDELWGACALWVLWCLGFAGTGVVVLGGGRQEGSCDGCVADRGGVVDAEDGGEVHGGGVVGAVSYTHLRAHETVLDVVCRLLLE